MKWCSPSDYLPDNLLQLEPERPRPAVDLKQRPARLREDCEIIELFPALRAPEPQQPPKPLRPSVPSILVASLLILSLSSLAALFWLPAPQESLRPLALTALLAATAACLALTVIVARRAMRRR